MPMLRSAALAAMSAALSLAIGLMPPSPCHAATADPASPAASASWRALESQPAARWSFTHADGTVHRALQRWTREAGWQLVWEVDRDFPIDAEVTLSGNFLDALRQAMAALRETDFPLQARVQAESRVVRVGRYLPEGDRR